MGIGFILFFCVVFLMIDESSGVAMSCMGENLPVSAVITLILDVDLAFAKLSSEA